jgi:hypothetical protein
MWITDLHKVAAIEKPRPWWSVFEWPQRALASVAARQLMVATIFRADSQPRN